MISRETEKVNKIETTLQEGRKDSVEPGKYVFEQMLKGTWYHPHLQLSSSTCTMQFILSACFSCCRFKTRLRESLLSSDWPSSRSLQKGSAASGVHDPRVCIRGTGYRKWPITADVAPCPLAGFRSSANQKPDFKFVNQQLVNCTYLHYVLKLLRLSGWEAELKVRRLYLDAGEQLPSAVTSLSTSSYFDTHTHSTFGHITQTVTAHDRTQIYLRSPLKENRA